MIRERASVSCHYVGLLHIITAYKPVTLQRIYSVALTYETGLLEVLSVRVNKLFSRRWKSEHSAVKKLYRKCVMHVPISCRLSSGPYRMLRVLLSEQLSRAPL